VEAGGTKLRIVFHITNTEEGLTATMDSPDQGANGIPVTTVTRNGQSLTMELKGIDIFVHWPSRNPNLLAAAVGKLAGDGLGLQMIDNRGVKVWPAGMAETFCTDSFRCRFVSENGTDMSKCIALLGRVAGAGIEIAATQSLRMVGGQAGYTLAQGQ
jgi:isocitrate dehydrogenase